jgi:hypothetical protein
MRWVTARADGLRDALLLSGGEPDRYLPPSENSCVCGFR